MIQYILTKEAIQLYEECGYGKTTRPTVITWCRVYGIGKKVGGRWKIDKTVYLDFLKKGKSCQ